MRLKFTALVKFLLVILLLQGCTHHYVANPDRYAVGLDKVPEIRTHGAIQLINGQPDTRDQLLVKMGMHKHLGSYHQMTDTAVKIGKKVLEDRGITTSGQASKSLKLSVVGAERIPAMWIFRIIVDLEVEKGDGETIIFKGDNSTGGHLYRGIDGAILKSVTTMLNDARIQAYLE